MITPIILGFAFGMAVAVISYKLKLINFNGAAAVFFLGWIIFGFGEIKWTVPILSFFIFSSILSKVRKKINPSVEKYFLKNDERDHVQVLANGGFPGLLAVVNHFHSSELIYITYVSAIASACSDTWATEIGTMIRAKTFDIIGYKQIEQGISGGVSLIGFIGAVLGSILISVSAFPWLSNISISLLVITAAGFLGSIVDSLLGASLQAKYFCQVCKSTVEHKIHCGQKAVFKKGLRYLDNDAVNFAASLAGGLLGIFSMKLLS